LTHSSEIHWPERYKPENCPVHIRNELDMDADPEYVWAWLIRAKLWPTWYNNSANVEIIRGSGPDLAEDTRFRWKTFGVTITSTVREFVPGQRIAWDAHAFGLDVYHAWVLQPSSKGCHVLTEETQHGFIARLGALFMPSRMYKFHQIWLEGLERQAQKGLPPTT